jgi:hypothetical protein
MKSRITKRTQEVIENKQWDQSDPGEEPKVPLLDRFPDGRVSNWVGEDSEPGAL